MKINRKNAVKLVREQRIGWAVEWHYHNEAKTMCDFLIQLFDITEDELAYRGKPTTNRMPASYWPPLSAEHSVDEWSEFFGNLD